MDDVYSLECLWERDYLAWLTSIATKAKNYNNLMTCLYFIDFTWFIPHDDNRASDGLALRKKWLSENIDSYDASSKDIIEFAEEPCSLLEMMVALAIRINSSLLEKDICYWFSCMLENIGLSTCTDERCKSDPVEFRLKVMRTGNRIVKRQYSKFGKGGLFPLNPNKKDRKVEIRDQRKVEIWYQMSFWLEENYYINGEFI